MKSQLLSLEEATLAFQEIYKHISKGHFSNYPYGIAVPLNPNSASQKKTWLAIIQNANALEINALLKTYDQLLIEKEKNINNENK